MRVSGLWKVRVIVFGVLEESDVLEEFEKGIPMQEWSA